MTQLATVAQAQSQAFAGRKFIGSKYGQTP